MKKMSLLTQPFILIALIFLTISARSQDSNPPKFEIEEHLNIQYYSSPSPDSSLTQLNILVPEARENAPVLIWIGQGAWAYVNKDVEMNICRQFAQNGITVVSAQHRLSPALLGETKNYDGIKHPEHVKDIAHAFKWVYENADTYGYDQQNIFVGGFSSGAHLAALLAMDNSYLKKLGLSNSMIKAIIPVGGGFDIPDYKIQLMEEDVSYVQNHINPVFGETHEEHVNASPTTFVDSLITPMLLISESDTYPYNRVFEALLVEKGASDVEVLNLHNHTHAGLWNELGNPSPSIYRDFILAYIEKWSAI